MILPEFTFNPRHWLLGINWDKSTVKGYDKDWTCEFVCVHLGPFLWTWNLSRGYEFIGPFSE